MAKRLEEAHQISVVTWFRYQYPAFKKLLYVIANGENVGSVRMNRLKMLGLVPGMPDLSMAIARQGYHGLFVEMKQPKGHLQKNQVEQHEELKQQGYKVVTAYGFDDAKVLISDYLKIEKLKAV